MSVKFSPKVTSVQFTGGNVKMTLVADAEAVNRMTKADLSELQGKVVTADLMPESVEVISYFDEEGKPVTVYTLDNGVWTEHKQEQLNMLDREKVTTKSDMVPVSEIDTFIMSANYVEYVGALNPKEIIGCLEQGLSVEEIAEEQGVSGFMVEDELKKARKHFAPFVLSAIQNGDKK